MSEERERERTTVERFADSFYRTNPLGRALDAFGQVSRAGQVLGAALNTPSHQLAWEERARQADAAETKTRDDKRDRAWTEEARGRQRSQWKRQDEDADTERRRAAARFAQEQADWSNKNETYEWTKGYRERKEKRDEEDRQAAVEQRKFDNKLRLAQNSRAEQSGKDAHESWVMKRDLSERNEMASSVNNQVSSLLKGNQAFNALPENVQKQLMNGTHVQDMRTILTGAERMSRALASGDPVKMEDTFDDLRSQMKAAGVDVSYDPQNDTVTYQGKGVSFSGTAANGYGLDQAMQVAGQRLNEAIQLYKMNDPLAAGGDPIRMMQASAFHKFASVTGGDAIAATQQRDAFIKNYTPQEVWLAAANNAFENLGNMTGAEKQQAIVLMTSPELMGMMGLKFDPETQTFIGEEGTMNLEQFRSWVQKKDRLGNDLQRHITQIQERQAMEEALRAQAAARRMGGDLSAEAEAEKERQQANELTEVYGIEAAVNQETLDKLKQIRNVGLVYDERHPVTLESLNKKAELENRLFDSQSIPDDVKRPWRLMYEQAKALERAFGLYEQLHDTKRIKADAKREADRGFIYRGLFSPNPEGEGKIEERMTAEISQRLKEACEELGNKYDLQGVTPENIGKQASFVRQLRGEAK